MDYIIILLATILIVVIAYMISTAISSTTTISDEVDMKNKSADISASSLSRPDATRYSYNIWIYMDKPFTGNKLIFNRANDLGLGINGTTSILSLKLYRRNPPATAVLANDKLYEITNNFPLQKWVFITISVDNSTIDIYLDGKLVKSVIDTVDTGAIRHNPDQISPITFDVIDGTYMTRFSRILSASDPQTAWNLYMKGSGSKRGLSNLVNRYNVNLSLVKDNVQAKSISLF